MDSFFGIGLAELFFIAVIALVVLGPERLPGTLREIAKMWGYVRNLGRELTSQFSEEFKALEDLDPRKLLNEMADEELKKDLKTLTKKPGAVSTKPTTPKATTPKPAPPKPATTTAKPASTTGTTSTTGKATAKSVAKAAEPPSDVQPAPAPTAEEASAATSQSAADNAEHTILPPPPATTPVAASEPVTETGSEEPPAADAPRSSAAPVRVNGASANGAAEPGENAG